MNMEKYKDPRWQKKRLKILERDKWICQGCCDTKSTLHIHHRYYIENKDPWDYPDEALVTLCDKCHETEKKERKEMNDLLIHSIRKNFLSQDIFLIADGFYSLKLHYPSDVAASVLYWILSDEVFKELTEKYFKYCKRMNEQREIEKLHKNKKRNT